MKKGFIATSLIYSFFLIICAVIVGFITISVHNNNLLNKINDNARNNLNYYSIGNILNGSYLNIDLYNPNINISNIKWIVFGKDSRNDVKIISDSIVLSRKLTDDDNGLIINSNVISFNNNLGYNRQVDNIVDTLIIPDIDNIIFTSNCVTNAYIVKETELNNMSNDIKDINKKYIYEKTNQRNYKYDFYLYHTNNFDLIDDDNLKTILENENDNTEDINIRLVLIINKQAYVNAGNGFITNPYHIIDDCNI